MPGRVADEEDVALSAFKSFCIAAQAGRFPQLTDRDDLWQILVMLTQRKAANLRQHETRDKRDYRLVRRQTDDASDFLNVLKNSEPDPRFALEIAENCERLLQQLGSQSLRQIALDKLEGYTNKEIAAKLGCAEVTVERRLCGIRRIWSLEEAES